MTTAHITQEIRDAASFIQRHHHDLAIDDLAMSVALTTLRRSGVWSMADIDLPDTTTPVEVTMQLHGTFCSGDRNRVIYHLLADGQEIGTAVHWTNKSMWPWGLTIASACIINFGFKSRADLIDAAQRFVTTGAL